MKTQLTSLDKINKILKRPVKKSQINLATEKRLSRQRYSKRVNL